MTFPEGLAFVYRRSWAFLVAFPFVILIPVVAEFAQHIVEMQAGMYDGIEGARAAKGDPARMTFGFVKTIALAVVGYWATRFYASGGDAAFTRRIEQRAVALFALVLALQALFSALSLFGFSGAMAVGFFVFGLIFTPLIARFSAAAPLGTWIRPLTSIRQLAPQLPFAFAFSIVAILPLMAVHYALGIAPMFIAAEGVKWALLVVDALVVGWLAAALAAVTWVIATRRNPPPELILPA